MFEIKSFCLVVVMGDLVNDVRAIHSLCTVFFWLSLPVHSVSLKRIDYPKQICLANPISFE